MLTRLIVTCQGGDVMVATTPFAFVSGRPSLDMVGTLMFRHRDEPVELLNEPRDVSSWALEAGLIHDSIHVSDAGLRRTKELRETIHRLMLDKVSDGEAAGRGLADLNAAARGLPLGLALVDGTLQRFGTLSQLHASLARDALELLGTPDVERLKMCAGDDCSRMYFDTSRNVTRRWCGMRQCGDRVKAANYRARRRALERKDAHRNDH